MKQCPYCGAEIREDARFCIRCMSTLDKKTLWTPPRFFRGGLAIGITIGILCGLLLGAAGFWAFGGKDQPDDAVSTTTTTTSSTSHTSITTAATTTKPTTTTTTTTASVTTLSTSASTTTTTIRTTGPSRADGLTALPLSTFPNIDWESMIGLRVYASEETAEYELLKGSYVELSEITVWEDVTDSRYPNDDVRVVYTFTASIPEGYQSLVAKFFAELAEGGYRVTGTTAPAMLVGSEGWQVECLYPRKYLSTGELTVTLSDLEEGYLDGGSGNEYSALLAEHMKEAEKLTYPETLPYESTFVGIIINTPYPYTAEPDVYSFAVSDGPNTLQCFQLPIYGRVPQKGDRVTIIGNLTQYGGKAQFYKNYATLTFMDEEE